ncbi:hypothetical protein MBEHAL_2398 [Halarchaeum acidiphilum MH1-52-1]|uniref:Small CPxCG-related zinc finger protein n=2 Tax=Halarchaeum acidiphilum TaxID=489138 RepID=U3AFS4_9EURY|nr:hypothetical protein MBEHAL_2398 [Halarchaeum acidiphilum MH1-52-1]
MVTSSVAGSVMGARRGRTRKNATVRTRRAGGEAPSGRDVRAGFAEARAFIDPAVERTSMPATMEVTCTADGCELDMAELHYTYDAPDDVSAADLRCPYCGSESSLEEIEL